MQTQHRANQRIPTENQASCRVIRLSSNSETGALVETQAQAIYADFHVCSIATAGYNGQHTAILGHVVVLAFAFIFFMAILGLFCGLFCLANPLRLSEMHRERHPNMKSLPAKPTANRESKQCKPRQIRKSDPRCSEFWCTAVWAVHSRKSFGPDLAWQHPPRTVARTNERSITCHKVA